MLLPEITALEPELQKESDRDLRKRSLALRYRVKSGEPLGRLVAPPRGLRRQRHKLVVRLDEAGELTTRTL